MRAAGGFGDRPRALFARENLDGKSRVDPVFVQHPDEAAEVEGAFAGQAAAVGGVFHPAALHHRVGVVELNQKKTIGRDRADLGGIGGASTPVMLGVQNTRAILPSTFFAATDAPADRRARRPAMFWL